MADQKKILLIGDSLALPGHLNLHEDTWICKLKKHFPNYDFITFFKRALTTDVLISMGGGESGIDKFPMGADCLEFFMPDYVVLQLGVVDCAPRLFSPVERKALSVAPGFLRSTVIKVARIFRTQSVKRADVPPEVFERNLRIYFERCQRNNVEKIVVILICIPSEKFKVKNPGIVDAVVQYNNLYKKIVDEFPFVVLVEPLDSTKYDCQIFEDGYHPNKTGHQLVYEAVASNLDI